MAKQLTDKECKELLSSWVSMTKHLSSLEENQLEKLLKKETEGQRRGNYIDRIHGRLSKLRAARERKQLKEG